MEKIKGIGVVAIVGIPTKDGHVFTLEALQKIAASNENMWMVGNELWAEVETPNIAYNVAEIVAALEKGEKPYGEFTMPFDEAVKTVKQCHGENAESLRKLVDRRV